MGNFRIQTFIIFVPALNINYLYMRLLLLEEAFCQKGVPARQLYGLFVSRHFLFNRPTDSVRGVCVLSVRKLSGLFCWTGLFAGKT